MKTTKTSKLTRDRYESSDHYRAQVQLNEKLVWAICYGAIFDYDSRDAGALRDSLSGAIERVTIEHFRALVAQPDFHWYFQRWMAEQVHEEMKEAVNAFLKTHFKI